MQTQRINITLPNNVVQQLSFSVPSGKRSKFIAEAVSEKLAKKKVARDTLQESLIKNKEFYKAVSRDLEEASITDWPQNE